MSVKIWYSFNGNNSSSVDVVWINKKLSNKLLESFISDVAREEIQFNFNSKKTIKAVRESIAEEGYYVIYEDSKTGFDQYLRGIGKRIFTRPVEEGQGIAIVFIKNKKPSEKQILNALKAD